MKKRAFFLLFLLILAYNVFSQEEIPLEGFIEDFGKEIFPEIQVKQLKIAHTAFQQLLFKK